ncbi:MAG: elongator complex protein 3 [Chloroflexota bacterium]|nr:elongator complex protein 3 [Chloroflexota bacterium]
MDKKKWRGARQYSEEQLQIAGTVLDEVRDGMPVMKAVRSHPLSAGGYVAKHTLVHVYRQRVESGALPESPDLLARIRMKPIRSLSGVSTVTVLTEPHDCPGNCLFCPDDSQLPKSYLKEEPGAARAFQNHFDPFLQVQSRLESYRAIGHPIDKIELLILGGSWSAYEESYREWFVKRCLDAMNGSDAETLEEAQTRNQRADSRNVGLVVETRPDAITPRELAHMRRLGVTKVQMGAQSFDDAILKLNCRGHGVRETLDACALLRAAGFKIVLHWMPNLMGASPESDREDFGKMWSGGFCPDELKIYPTQLLQEAPLYRFWQAGKYQPYTTQQLIDLIADIKPSIPIYTRVNRIIRDIPANYIQAGSLRSSLRQDVKLELERRGQRCRCIRCREIRGKAVDAEQLILDDFVYQPADAEEHFISFATADDRLAGYLRLSLPKAASAERAEMRAGLDEVLPELRGAALIREVHIYGQSLEVGSEKAGAAQHSGLGKRLLEEAGRIAGEHGYHKLAVIAAIGTHLYYQKRGFKKEHLYMTKSIDT